MHRNIIFRRFWYTIIKSIYLQVSTTSFGVYRKIFIITFFSNMALFVDLAMAYLL